jgi:hypothetical protein
MFRPRAGRFPVFGLTQAEDMEIDEEMELLEAVPMDVLLGESFSTTMGMKARCSVAYSYFLCQCAGLLKCSAKMKFTFA